MEQKQITLNDVYAKLIALEKSMKKLDKIDQYLEDLEFARRTEEAYQRHEAGEFIEMDEKGFFEELEKW